MATEKARAFLDEAIAEHGATYSDISRLIGKNPAYIQQFIKRGTPRRLDEIDRHKIARHLGIPEYLLSGLPLSNDVPVIRPRAARQVTVPRLALSASAGAGAYEHDERPTDAVVIDSRWLRANGVQTAHVSIIRVDGESMAPTLNDGDEIMINHLDDEARLRDGIYVLRLDDILLVKRVAIGPRRGVFSILSDNGLFPSWTNIDPALVRIVGRVFWVGRTVR